MKVANDSELDTTVFSIDKFSFKYLKNNLEYAFPGSPKDRKTWKFVAFYRTKPISAITHYGKIKEVIPNADVNGKYRIMNFGYHAPDEATKIVLENLKELEDPVKSTKGRSIQSFYYTNLKNIKCADNIPELISLREG